MNEWRTRAARAEALLLLAVVVQVADEAVVVLLMP